MSDVFWEVVCRFSIITIQFEMGEGGREILWNYARLDTIDNNFFGIILYEKVGKGGRKWIFHRYHPSSLKE